MKPDNLLFNEMSQDSTEKLCSTGRKRKLRDLKVGKKKKKKWTSLSFIGPALYPPFKVFPTSVTMKYKGIHVKLKPKTEEFAYYYIKNLRKVRNKKVYKKNFFKDWFKIMVPEEQKLIRRLKYCNFDDMETHIKESKRMKLEKQEIKSMMAERQYCRIDGVKEKIKNPMVEPPGVFVGKGNHPLNGRIKLRILPEDVTVNSETGCKAPEGHTFGKIIQNKEVLFLAFWDDHLLKKRKYIQLHASSSQNGKKDKLKFERARRLDEKLHHLRERYISESSSTNDKVSQRALALCLIDKFCLRPGYPKIPGLTAMTKGCCSLTKSDMRLYRENESCFLKLKFLGKSCVHFKKKKIVSRRVYNLIRRLLRQKEDGDRVFDLVKASTLNKYFKQLCKDSGISLKTIRTHHASVLLEKKLDKIVGNSGEIMIKEYRVALGTISRICNHKSPYTAKMNYTDPRITVEWCRKWDIPIKEIFTPFQEEKFRWAIEGTETNFRFAKK